MATERLNARVGAKLRALRLAAGHTQQKWAELANRAAERLGMEGYAYQSWGKAERADVVITVDHIEVAAATLGVPPSAFFDGEPSPTAPPLLAPALTPEEATVISIFRTQGRKGVILYLMAGLK